MPTIYIYRPESGFDLRLVQTAEGVVYRFTEQGECVVGWHGSVQVLQSVDALRIKTKKNGPPTVDPLKVPHANADLLAWVCGFSRDKRTSVSSKFAEIARRETARHRWLSDIRKDADGDWWSYWLGRGGDPEKIYALAAYISSDILRPTAVKFLVSFRRNGGYFRAPDHYIRVLLKERLYFTEADLDRVFNAGPA